MKGHSQMKAGISTSKATGADASCLYAQGVRAVLRYYSKSKWKCITKSEANALVTAGIELGIFYEDAPTSKKYFTVDRAKQDVANAVALAALLGQPQGSAIYFTVDYDASEQDLGVVASYFETLKKAIADAGYLVGVYGSGRVCKKIKDSTQLATYSCLAESRAWGGTSTYTTWDILQVPGGTALCSLNGAQPGKEADYETCHAQDDYGGFTLSHSVGSGVADPVSAAVTLEQPSSFTQRAVEIATQQWVAFDKQAYDLDGHATHVGHKEAEEGFYKIVGTYWAEGTNTLGVDGRNHELPWSAAFISWVMRKAGAGTHFRYSTQHSVYISQAIRDRLSARSDAGFWGWRLNERKPAVGDLICWARQAAVDYDHQFGGNYAGHTDIVTEIHLDRIVVIGGNVGDSVTQRPFALNTAGYLPAIHSGGETLFALMECKL
jgi:hypothetical protein